MANSNAAGSVVGNSDPRGTLAPCGFPCREAGCAHAVAAHGERWVIRMGHAGFNSPANNRAGYATEAAARAAVRKYSSR